jgi:cytochrome c556
MRRQCLLAFALATITASSVLGHEGATGIVKERMDLMAVLGTAMKAVSPRARQKRDVQSIKAAAKAIKEQAARITAVFPPGSGGHPSDAKSNVWTNWTDFEARARAFETESAKLADMDPSDVKAFNAQTLRVSDACDSCHELYRAKQRPHR